MSRGPDSAPPPAAPVDDSISLKQGPFSTLLAFGFTNAMTWMIALGTPMVLLAGQLGASTVEVGLAFAGVFLMLPMQILATVGLPRFGYKKQMIFAWSVRSIFLLIPLGLAIARPEEPAHWMVYAMVGSVLAFAFFRSLGSCAVMPWVYSHVPDSIRGRYFATDQVLSGASGVFTLLLCSTLFALLPDYDAFAWEYGFALIGSILSVVLLSKVPDVEPPKATSVPEIIRETPQWCTRPGGFRQYLGFMITASLVGTSFQPFIAYYLQVEIHLSPEKILFYAAIQFVGSISGALFLRPRIDKMGVKPAFRISLGIQILLMGYWIALIAGLSQLLVVVPLGYFLFGFATAHWTSANLKYLPRICPEEKRALTVSIHSSVVGVIGGIAPICWGFLLREPGDAAGVRTPQMIAYLATTATIQTGLAFYVSRLTSKGRHLPPIFAESPLLRPFRNLATLVNLIPHEAKSSTAEQADERT